MKEIKGWPGYFITDDGTVFTARSNSGASDKPPRPMKPQPNRTGHLRVTLLNLGRKKICFVHHLVLEAFVGPRPEGLIGRHKDGNPANNSLQNLQWSTQSQNRMDMWDHGTMPHGEDLHSAKLSESEVVSIRERFSEGDIDVVEIAKTYGVNSTTIGSVLRGQWWAHVGGPIVTSCRPRGARHWKRRGR
jgi:hypothetical protein